MEDPTPGWLTPSDDHGSPDPLDELRTELEERVDGLAVADRVRRFEHANDVLARELAQLDEV